MHIDELDTPVLIVDLDALEANSRRYQSYFDSHQIGLRPHIKTHKTLAIAHRQIRDGAIGLTCQKVGEAEVMASGGLTDDLLIPYNILGKQKLDRLTALARQAKITVAADSAHTVDGLSQAAEAAGIVLGVLVEIETGAQRTGTPNPAATRELARRIHDAPGLALRGVMGFPTPPSVRPIFEETLSLLDADGLPHPIVSGGSTAFALEAHEIPELTEYRIGEYIVGGAKHLHGGRHSVEQCALRVIATVISRPVSERMILDSGSKTLSASTLEVDGGQSIGHIVEYPDARFYSFSEEHGHVDLSASEQRPNIGDRVQVIPVHPCPCVNLHDRLVAVRNDQVEAIWPIAARGQIR